MSSVENSFGKLLSDVVTDVRETIGCTILAVKQVLALGGIYNESSDYDERCRGVKGANIQDKNENPIITPFQSKSTEKPLSERVSEQIEDSISSVHNTMFEVIDSNNAYKSIVKAKANIAHERNRLSEISSLLRHELANISEDVKRELRKIESYSNHPTVDGIWSEIKALHQIELSHENTPEATEIHHILNEIVSILHGDEIPDGRPSLHFETAAENETNDAFLEIENQFEEMEQENKDAIIFDKDSVEDSGVKIDSVEKSENFPIAFKVVAKKIKEETSRTFRFADGSSQEYEHVVPTTTQKPMSTEKKVEIPEASLDYNSFFQLAPKDSPARVKAAQEAKKLIEKSKKTDAIMNNYFKKADKVGTNVFDDPALLEFG